jgi:hypothetical protein
MSRHALLFVAACGLCGIVMPARADDLRVRDIPIPEGATDVSTMKRRGDIRFQMPSDFKTVGNDYAKTLTGQKWAKSGRDNLQRNFWVQTFAKGQVSLEVRVDSRGEGSEVRLTPKGMLWEEDDQPTPKDLPLPKDAKELEYDDFFESIEFGGVSDQGTRRTKVDEGGHGVRPGNVCPTEIHAGQVVTVDRHPRRGHRQRSGHPDQGDAMGRHEGGD